MGFIQIISLTLKFSIDNYDEFTLTKTNEVKAYVGICIVTAFWLNCFISHIFGKREEHIRNWNLHLMPYLFAYWSIKYMIWLVLFKMHATASYHARPNWQSQCIYISKEAASYITSDAYSRDNSMWKLSKFELIH